MDSAIVLGCVFCLVMSVLFGFCTAGFWPELTRRERWIRPPAAATAFVTALAVLINTTL